MLTLHNLIYGNGKVGKCSLAVVTSLSTHCHTHWKYTESPWNSDTSILWTHSSGPNGVRFREVPPFPCSFKAISHTFQNYIVVCFAMLSLASHEFILITLRQSQGPAVGMFSTVYTVISYICTASACIINNWTIMKRKLKDILNFSCKLVLLGAGPPLPWEEGGPLYLGVSCPGRWR